MYHKHKDGLQAALFVAIPSKNSMHMLLAGYTLEPQV
jgi:hypothetical protein